MSEKNADAKAMFWLAQALQEDLTYKGSVYAPCWSTPLPRPAGIYWRRTGGKTWRVEVVR